MVTGVVLRRMARIRLDGSVSWRERLRGMVGSALLLAICLPTPLMLVAGCCRGSTNGQSGATLPGAMRADWGNILRTAKDLWAEIPRKSAPFVSVMVKWKGSDIPPEREVRGWLVGQSDREYVVRTPFGGEERIPKELHQDLSKPHSAYGNYWSGAWGYAEPPRVEEIPIEEEVTRFVEWQQTGEPRMLYWGRKDVRILQPGDTAAHVYGTLLAAWLDSALRPGLRNRVLSSALASVNEKAMAASLRTWFGERYGYQMLVAFVGDRDYDRAYTLAARIPPDTVFYEYAKRLRRELPKRSDDFRMLKLPSFEEWVSIKAGLDRAGQVRFLCDRMRLLNCFQLEQPGTVDITWRQYRGASGMTANAAWSKRESGTILTGSPIQPEDVVINPYVELTGKQSELAARVCPPAAPLKLTAADIPLIAPYLKEDWSILAVGFPRDFMDQRHLLSTRPIFCEIMNGLAGQRLCDIDSEEWASPSGRESIIERAKSWAKEHAGQAKGTP